MPPIEPPLRRPPGSRPSLRAGPGPALPGSPRINPFGAEDYTRAAEIHSADPHRQARAAGHRPGQSTYATGSAQSRDAAFASEIAWDRRAYAPGWSLGHRLAPARATPQRAAPRPAPPARDTARDTASRSFWPFRRAAAAAHDPAPSRLAYRLNRMWLTPAFRRSLTVGSPIALIGFCIGLIAADPARRAYMVETVEGWHAALIDRAEFQVGTVSVPDVSPELRAMVMERLDLSLPISSFRMDLEALRASVEAIDAVRTADLRIASGGDLLVTIVERKPAVVWRSRTGLELLDAEGHRIARLAARHAVTDLLLVAGDGASDHVAEALELAAVAKPLQSRLRGLVRVGERRWDLVLDRDQRIMLPEIDPMPALERALALDRAQDLLARDVTHVDLRHPARPVLRLSEGALDTLYSIRQSAE